MPGLTSPMSMAGTLAQGNAEFLAISVLMQMVRQGTPTIYATLPDRRRYAHRCLRLGRH